MLLRSKSSESNLRNLERFTTANSKSPISSAICSFSFLMIATLTSSNSSSTFFYNIFYYLPIKTYARNFFSEVFCAFCNAGRCFGILSTIDSFLLILPFCFVFTSLLFISCHWVRASLASSTVLSPKTCGCLLVIFSKQTSNTLLRLKILLSSAIWQ